MITVSKTQWPLTGRARFPISLDFERFRRSDGDQAYGCEHR